MITCLDTYLCRGHLLPWTKTFGQRLEQKDKDDCCFVGNSKNSTISCLLFTLIFVVIDIILFLLSKVLLTLKLILKWTKLQIPVYKLPHSQWTGAVSALHEVISSLFTSGQEEKTGDQIAIKSPGKGSVVSWNVCGIK